MYQALYRKYRPRFFRDVSGQENITSVLSKQVAEHTFGHAYLFTGSRGIGKTTCAKILAKAVNCPYEKDGEPCGECAICKGIDDGSMLDVTEMDAASNRGIEDIRKLRDEALFTPAVAKFRVYIIDECHMLSKDAANAMLKIMEEPPEHIIFILATTEVHKLPVTILSRCLRFDFRRMSPDVIAERVKFVCARENISIDDDAAVLIGKLADGGMRDALSMLDVCRSDEKITLETVYRCCGLAGREHLFDLTDKIIQKSVTGALEAVEVLYDNSADIARLCDELIDHFRNLMVISCVGAGKNTLNVLPSEQSRLDAQAKALGQARIFYCVSVLQDTLVKMSRSSSKRLEFELAMMKLCSPELSQTNDALLARIERLESEITMLKAGRAVYATEAVGAKTNQPAENTVITPKTEPAPTPKSEEQQTGEVPFEHWETVVEILRGKYPMLYFMLKESKAYVSGGRVLIDSENESFISYMQKSEDAREHIKDAITEVSGIRYGIGPHKKTQQEKKDLLSELSEKARLSGIELL